MSSSEWFGYQAKLFPDLFFEILVEALDIVGTYEQGQRISSVWVIDSVFVNEIGGVI
ncbi:11420_t:CDS:2, partial [Gigaspora rosea]